VSKGRTVATHTEQSGLKLYTSCHPLTQLIWYGHVLRKEDDDWLKKGMEYEVEGSRRRGRPKTTWREVVQEDCQACKLNREDAMDRSTWRKLIKDG